MSERAIDEIEMVYGLILSIGPELRCIRDCRFTKGKTAIVRPDDAAIEAADKLLAWAKVPT